VILAALNIFFLLWYIFARALIGTGCSSYTTLPEGRLSADASILSAD
jgi:hypothetical protein